MLRLIHEGHLGIEKGKRRARDILYWPNMNKDVYDTVSRCDVCQEYRYVQQQQPLQMHERPDRPWAKVACDIFYLKQVLYLLTVDYYSHYPEIALLSDESSRQVIIHLKSLFSRCGILSECISEGGSQFTIGYSVLYKHGTSTAIFRLSYIIIIKNIQTDKHYFSIFTIL